MQQKQTTFGEIGVGQDFKAPGGSLHFTKCSNTSAYVRPGPLSPMVDIYDFKKSTPVSVDDPAAPNIIPPPGDAAEPSAEVTSARSSQLTLADIEAEISSTFYFTANDGVLGSRPGFEEIGQLPDIPDGFSRVTFCVLTLHNGHREVGINYGPFNPANFSQMDAQRYAYEDAISKLWNPLGYLLRHQLATAAPKAVDPCTCGPSEAACSNCCRGKPDSITPIPNGVSGVVMVSQGTPAPRVITPTVGRKVWYRPTGKEHDDMHVIGLGVPLDATVVYVWNDRMVNLLVVDHAGNQHIRTSVDLIQPGEPIGTMQSGYAEWMPYQVGQAKAADKEVSGAAIMANVRATETIGNACESNLSAAAREFRAAVERRNSFKAARDHHQGEADALDDAANKEAKIINTLRDALEKAALA